MRDDRKLEVLSYKYFNLLNSEAFKPIKLNFHNFLNKRSD